MATRLQRSISEPIRQDLSWHDIWQGPDKGLIYCWEKGRMKRVDQPEDAACAERGELIALVWKGGVRKKLKAETVRGTLNYLATWQGIRGEDLDIDMEGERVIICSKFKQAIVFSAGLIWEAEQE